MLVFGHLGIGSKIVSPWSRGLSRRLILLGTLVPDLIDKPVYYVSTFLSGRISADNGLLSGSRTFGHTGILLLILSGLAIAKRSKVIAALVLGMASHLVLDNVMDRWIGSGDESSALLALVFPLKGFRFGASPFATPLQHMALFAKPPLLAAEIMGLAILLWDQWKISRLAEIRRLFRRRRKHRT